MARPLRIEFAGALYHVTSRGDRREAIYADDEDRTAWLEVLGTVVEDFNWACHAYCLMTNHYHVVVETPDGNLAKGMRQLNGVYTKISNRRHKTVGHLFQGRYTAILVDKDAYLMELARYVVLNPVRARIVKRPERWRWSSYCAMVGLQNAPAWLCVDAMLGQFGRQRASAIRRYAEFVGDGIGAPDLWAEVRNQIYLGDEKFVARMQAKLGAQAADINIPRTQRRQPPRALSEIERLHVRREQAIVAAHNSGGYSYQEIAQHFGVHFTTVGRIVRADRMAKRITNALKPKS